MNLLIEWQYKTPNGLQTTFRSEAMPAAHALVLAEDLQRTGRMQNMTLFDEQDSTWTLKELKRYIKELETEPHNISIYFDGGFERETATAGLGCVIYYEQNGKAFRLRKNQMVNQLESNNEAEYAALYLAITELDLLGGNHQAIKIVGDSQVVINELNGEWAVTDNVLSNWADKIEKKLHKIGITPHYEHIPRTANGEADQLASQALKGISIEATLELT